MATRLQRLRRGGLTETFPFAGPQFRKAAPWLLAGVALLGLAVRVFPALRYGVWGSDSGEYIYLTQRLLDGGQADFDYRGWGIAYPYFPGMFVVSGAVAAVIGVDVFHATQWTVPVLASALAVLVGLLGYRITSDPRVAIVASAFVATSAATVLTTSHAMPGTLGQLFLLGLLALLPEAHRDARHNVVLGILAVALVWTHHLTTYFAVGIVAFTAFYREMTQRGTDWPRLRIEGGLAGFLLALAAVWWLGVATPFREDIVGDALPLNPWLTVALFLAALAALPLIVRLKRKRSDWLLVPHYPPFPRQRWTALAVGAGIWLLVLFVSLVSIPGSNISVSPLVLVFILPVLAFLAFTPLGATSIRFHRAGMMCVAGMWALLASLLFAVVTQSRVLFPFRHVDYLVMLVAPLAAFGMLMVYDQTLASRIPSERPRARATMIAAFSLLIALSLVLSFPPREVIGGFEEGISQEELDAVLWVKEHPDVVAPNSTIAADHRVSSLLWGIGGLRPTWDYTPRTYHAETADDALDELSAAFLPHSRSDQRIDFVFLSPQIERGVALVQWENSAPMSEAAISKFDDPRFTRVYAEDGVRIFRVEWPLTTEA